MDPGIHPQFDPIGMCHRFQKTTGSQESSPLPLRSRWGMNRGLLLPWWSLCQTQNSAVGSIYSMCLMAGFVWPEQYNWRSSPGAAPTINCINLDFFFLKRSSRRRYAASPDCPLSLSAKRLSFKVTTMATDSTAPGHNKPYYQEEEDLIVSLKQLGFSWAEITYRYN